jgi:hypothetical protein
MNGYEKSPDYKTLSKRPFADWRFVIGAIIGALSVYILWLVLN